MKVKHNYLLSGIFKRPTIKTATAIGVILLTVVGCTAEPVRHRPVGTEAEVSRQIIYKESELGGRKFLHSANYWSACEGKTDGIAFQYKLELIRSGEMSQGIYFRLKSSSGAYYIERAVDNNGNRYPLHAYFPEQNTEKNTTEIYSLSLSDQQLEAVSNAALNVTLIGATKQCKVRIEQPINAAFYKKSHYLINDNNWEKAEEMEAVVQKYLN